MCFLPEALEKEAQLAEGLVLGEAEQEKEEQIGSEERYNLPLTSGGMWNRFLGDCA
jgi:hypothetical protein